MTLTFYSCAYCPWAARTWLALKEAEIDFELVEIDLSKPREPWYLEQINPVGKVPALKLEDGTILCESSVCCEYIADVSGKFLPKDPLARAEIKFFIETFASKFPSSVLAVLSSPAEKQGDLLRGAVSLVNTLLQKYLKGGPFLGGSSDYTLAEIDCVPFLARFNMLGEAGLYAKGLFEEVRKDLEFATFNQYLDNCLKRKSHQDIWNQEINLGIARKRREALLAANDPTASDHIFVQDLNLLGNVGLSSFSFAERKFPLTISLDVKTKSIKPGVDDYAISYGDVARECSALVENEKFESLETLAAAVLKQKSSIEGWQRLIIAKEGGLLRAEKEVFSVSSDGKASYSVVQLRIACIIGVYDHERLRKQDVVVNLSLLQSEWKLEQAGKVLIEEASLRESLEIISKAIEDSSFKTVEALAEKICELGFAVIQGSFKQIEVWVSKPSALVFAKHSGVCIKRNRQ